MGQRKKLFFIAFVALRARKIAGAGAAATSSFSLQRFSKSTPDLAVAGAGKRTLNSLDDSNCTFNDDAGHYARQRMRSASESSRYC